MPRVLGERRGITTLVLPRREHVRACACSRRFGSGRPAPKLDTAHPSAE